MWRVTRHHRIFWVGLLKGGNSAEKGFVIYDPRKQARTTSDKYVTLFELAEMRSNEFRKEVVRSLIGHPGEHDESVIQAALDKYLQAVGIDVEGEWEELQAQQRRFTRNRYESLCWQCQNNVDDETLPRCSTGCGWVKCDCGSCLCDMPELKRLERSHTVKIRYIDNAVSLCSLCRGVCYIASACEQQRREQSGSAYVPDLSNHTRCPQCSGKGYQSFGDVVA